MATFKIEIKNRWTAKVQFTAEVETSHNASAELKLGVAVRAAYASDAVLRGADLRDAVLSGADLSGADLRGAVLRDADLRDADLRGAVLRGAVLRDADLRGAVLSDADLRGADLRGADLSGADLSDAVLRGADLRGADLRGAVLRDADLRGAVLSDADLRGADLRGAVLSGADLSGADLRGADLRGAVLSGAPKIENIDAKILAAIEENKARGTNGLEMSSWHGSFDIDPSGLNEENWCETTHCRAGYAVCIAGKAGFDLERSLGGNTAAAATLLYLKSTPDEPIPDFYATNEAAMADIRARAAKQTASATPS